MRIFITGIRGFLGSAIAAHMDARGHAVCGSARRAADPPPTLRRMELAEPFDAAVFDGADVVVHCAHDFAVGAAAKNTGGTRAWYDAAAARGVQQQIFLSSHSAGASAETEYGRIKSALEPLFLRAGQCVVRPGLVIGDGGLFQKQRAALRRTPLVPMIGGGRQPTAVVGLPVFLAALAVIVERDLRGPFNLFYEPQPTYRDFVTAVKRVAGQRARFLPVPYHAALAFTAALQKLRVPFPVKPGQIAALAANTSSVERSDLYRLLSAAPGSFALEDALRAASENRHMEACRTIS